jgi:gamma-glutamylcyclotransferase (GGCT)/AIG2-like uncharacterized protein YtfP
VKTGTAAHPLLFVYGTLMRGFREQLEEKVNATFLGEGTIKAELYDLGDYPGARLAGAASDSFVRGELYRLWDPEHAAGVLDEYEGCFPSDPGNSLFTRELVTVRLQDGGKRNAWTYLYNRPVDNASLIRSGNYRHRGMA